MKNVTIIACLLSLTFLWAAEKELHPCGGIYEDFSKIPGMIEDDIDGIEFDPPPAVDHSANMPPVGDQGSQGSCTAWAVAYNYKSHQEWMEHAWSLAQPEHQFSPAFVYNHINGGADNGSGTSDAMKVLCENGCANMAEFPYTQSNWTRWPAESTYLHAIPYRCQSRHYIYVTTDQGIQAAKQHVADGDCAILGIWVWSNFDNIEQFDTVYCVADLYGSNRGGHNVCIVGYDDNKMTNDGPGAFRVVNSWGTSWGSNGYFWMSYEALKDSRMCYGTVAYTVDRIAYSPEALIRFKITQSAREWISMTVGIGNDWFKYIFDWSRSPSTPNPFPDNNIVFDITQGIPYADAYDTNNVYLWVRDLWTDGNEGTVDHLSVINNEWGAYSKSFETPMTIPDDRTPIYVNMTHPAQRLHWQSFHRLPANTGCTDMTGSMDSVEVVWSFSAGSFVKSSPALGDMNADGVLDVVIAAYNGKISAIDGISGDTVWQNVVGSDIISTPFLADVDQDGLLEVIIGSQDAVHALNSEDGQILWTYTAQGWVYSSPCCADIDEDDCLEIIFTGYDGRLYCINGEDGSFVWSMYTGASINSSPCLGNLDGEHHPEIVFGCSNNYVYAVNADDGSFLWAFATREPVTSSPCLGDIDDDGTLEVLIGSQDKRIYALDGETGDSLWSYETNAGVHSSPCVGDIDDDDLLEVIVGSNDATLYALNAEDGSLLWSYDAGAEISSSPALGDVDSDDELEVVVGSRDKKVYAFNGTDGSVLWQYETGNDINSSPALGDLNGDGKLEVIIGSDDWYVYALAGITGVEEFADDNARAARFSLSHNYPNPVTGNTTIQYTLARAGHVQLKLFDVTGREVTVLVNEEQTAGSYHVEWDITQSQGIANGVYFYQLSTEGYSQTRKLVVAR